MSGYTTYQAVGSVHPNRSTILDYCNLAYSALVGEEDRDVGVGVFPQREKVFVSGECADARGVGIGALRTQIIRPCGANFVWAS